MQPMETELLELNSSEFKVLEPKPPVTVTAKKVQHSPQCCTHLHCMCHCTAQGQQ
jgi:hypothetical protein